MHRNSSKKKLLKIIKHVHLLNKTNTSKIETKSSVSFLSSEHRALGITSWTQHAVRTTIKISHIHDSSTYMLWPERYSRRRRRENAGHDQSLKITQQYKFNSRAFITANDRHQITKDISVPGIIVRTQRMKKRFN